MTDDTELTDEEVQEIILQIDALVDKLMKVLAGEPRSQMITAFAYIIACNLNSEEDAKEVIPNLIEQICTGWQDMRDARSFQ